MKLTRPFAFSLVLALSVSSVLADETTKTAKSDKKKKSTTTTEVVETPKTVAKAPEAARASSSYSGQSESSVTGSIGAVDGNFVFGPGFQMEWPVIIEGNQFAVGWQTGFYYSAMTETFFGLEAKSKAWSIPIMASGKYIFDSSVGFLKPYFALAFGLGIDHVTGDVVAASVFARKSETNIHFTLFARPGVTFGETQHWFAELPIGVMFTDFAIMPTIGYHF